jgi:uncharacterized membrane protein YhaH (DUF805 family)
MKWLMVALGINVAHSGSKVQGFLAFLISVAGLLLLVVLAAVIVNRVRDRRRRAGAKSDLV